MCIIKLLIDKSITKNEANKDKENLLGTIFNIIVL